MIEIDWEYVDAQCGECGKKYQTAKSPFTGELISNKCFECKILERIDDFLYHFFID